MESSYSPVQIVSIFRHRPSGSFITFDYFTGNYIMPEDRSFKCERSPGFHLGTEVVAFYDWTGQLACTREWLGLLKMETEAPDLWGELRRSRQLLTAAVPEDNSPLTSDEVKLLRERLEVFRHELLGKMSEHAEALTEGSTASIR